MKFITVRDLRTSPARIWRELPSEQEMVITNNGKPIALLTPRSAESLEQTLDTIRRARAMRAVREIQRQAEESGAASMTEEEIQEEIRKYRASRKR